MVSSSMRRNGCIVTIGLIYSSYIIYPVTSFSSKTSTTRSFGFGTSDRCTFLFHSRRDSSEEDVAKKSNFIQGKKNQIKSILKPVSLSLLTAALSTHQRGFLANNPLKTPPAHASAPLVAIPKVKSHYAQENALKKARDKLNNSRVNEAMNHRLKCEEIEFEEGKEAREAYEAEHNTAMKRRDKGNAIHRKKLLYELANQGMCPFADVEGVRQLFLHDEEIDLSKIPSTEQQKEILDLLRNKRLAGIREKQRFTVKCIVDDLVLKGEDPVAYLEANKDKTREIFKLSENRLNEMIFKYKEIIAERGSLSGIKAETPFESSVAILGVQDAVKIAKVAKITKKAEAARLKVQAKEAKMKERLAAKAEATRIKADAKDTVANNAETEAVTTTEAVEASGLDETESDSSGEVSNQLKGEGDVVSTDSKDASRALPLLSAATVLGGGVTFKILKSKALKAENERQRQFKLLMGEDDDEGEDLENRTPTEEPPSPKKAPSRTPPPVTVPKRRRAGLSSVFSKKDINSRETDFTKLVEDGAAAPEFAILLAKILTFGAKGRFPTIISLPGNMPMDDFNLDEGKKLLIGTRDNLGLSSEASAELFANVVNCMIIDIIDLASSSLGAKDDKDRVTNDGLNIVMDFMDHAASLFDSVANGVVITPVTYGGTLAKKKLEQMFAIYSSSIMSEDNVTEERVDNLQGVFNIKDKRAETLVQQATMKKYMKMLKDGDMDINEMMKDGGGMDMNEMMKDAGGMDINEMMKGMGVGGQEFKNAMEEMSEEDINMMAKTMKELGIDVDELTELSDSEIDKMLKEDVIGEDYKEMVNLCRTLFKKGN